MIVYGLLALSTIVSVIELVNTSIFISHQYEVNDTSSSSPPNLRNFVFAFRHVLRLLENLALFVGILNFHRSVRKSKRSAIRIRLAFTEYCNSKWSLGILLALTFILSYTAACLISVCFYITTSPPLSLQRAYSGLAIILVFTDDIKLLSMLVVTLIVRSEWQRKLQRMKEERLLERTKDKPGDKQLQSYSKEMIRRRIEDYRNSGRSLANLHNIFQHWFVLEWIICFISVLFNSLLALKILLDENFSDRLFARSLVVLTDVVRFVTPYICGNVMNHYHYKYRNKLKKSVLVKCSVEGLCHAQHGKLIPKRGKYQFTPSVLWISVPLENPEYLLSIVLALISFFFTISVKYID